jgi:hypothetical protein
MGLFSSKSDTERSLYQQVLDAYKLGGMPAALIVVGVGLLAGGVADSAFNALANVEAGNVLLAGVAVLCLGALCWVVETNAKGKMQLAMIKVLEEMVKGAQSVSRDGANYQSALRDVNPAYHAFLQTLVTASQPKTERQEAK